MCGTQVSWAFRDIKCDGLVLLPADFTPVGLWTRCLPTRHFSLPPPAPAPPLHTTTTTTAHHFSHHHHLHLLHTCTACTCTLHCTYLLLFTTTHTTTYLFALATSCHIPHLPDGFMVGFVVGGCCVVVVQCGLFQCDGGMVRSTYQSIL